MRVTALGVVRRSGVSGKSGQAYDFAQVIVTKPIDRIEREKMKIQGHGFESVGLDADNGVIDQAAKIAFPCEVDLVTEQRMAGRGLATVVVGIKAVAVKAVA